MSASPFPRAVRSATTTVGVFIGPSGSGKTYTALEVGCALAKSLGKRVLMVDTENGRGLHYSERFDYDYVSIGEPFRPDAFRAPIKHAVESGAYGVVIVDSFSHEWAGYGGLVDWHDEILSEKVERSRKLYETKKWTFDEYKQIEKLSPGAWSEPKQNHKKFMQWLLQVPGVHIILCARAEEKIEFSTDKDGKNVIQATTKPGSKYGWAPILEKSVIFEATYSLLFLWTNQGVPIHIKVQDQHKAFFPEDRQLTGRAGELLAEWANPKPSVSVDMVLRTIDAAADVAALKAAWPEPASLKRLTTDQQKQVTEFYKAKAKELKDK